MGDRRASGAAHRLGLKRTTLVGKMKKLGIARPTLRNDESDFSEVEMQMVMATGA
jgi:hypothetical protein